MQNENAKSCFDRLFNQKEELEVELGYQLDWQ